MYACWCFCFLNCFWQININIRLMFLSVFFYDFNILILKIKIKNWFCFQKEIDNQLFVYYVLKNQNKKIKFFLSVSKFGSPKTSSLSRFCFSLNMIETILKITTTKKQLWCKYQLKVYFYVLKIFLKKFTGTARLRNFLAFCPLRTVTFYLL